MPSLSPQGSRGGLVAAVVVFTVLFVASTIFAIYYGVQDSKAEESLASLTTRYRSIANDIDSADVTTLISQAQGDQKLAEPTALAEAMRQRDELRRLIVGTEPASTTQPADESTQDTVAQAIAKAQQAVSAANGVLGASGVSLPADNLLGAVANLSLEVSQLQQAAQNAMADRDLARAQAAKDSENAQNVVTQVGSTVDQAKQDLQSQIDAANDAIKKAQDATDAARKTFEDEQSSTAAALDASDKQRTDLTNRLDELSKDLTQLRDKLAGRRIQVEDAMIRRPEGEIATISDADTVYINLGQGDQIVPGMTFEVYDKTLPMPKLGGVEDDENPPVGKASIEVTHVLLNGSECHVTHVEPGQQIVQGDRILNIVYDRNVKFNFYVYGDFDISRSGRPTPGGADLIKRLILQWGGAIDPKLDVQTDFVVVGAPPDVPAYSADDLQDPLNAQNLANAKRASEAYDRVIEKAAALHVPILNQTKFLYFTGYYDLALR